VTIKVAPLIRTKTVAKKGGAITRVEAVTGIQITTIIIIRIKNRFLPVRVGHHIKTNKCNTT
jgi:hypothetical protein